jgi:hypothetical protein
LTLACFSCWKVLIFLVPNNPTIVACRRAELDPLVQRAHIHKLSYLGVATSLIFDSQAGCSSTFIAVLIVVVARASAPVITGEHKRSAPSTGVINDTKGALRCA